MNLKTIITKLYDSTRMILTVPSVLFSNRDAAFIVAEHLVDDFEEGRPDLIAARYYNDPALLDIILKFNGISDPFSIHKGDRLRIPTSEIPLKKFNRPAQVEENLVKQQFIDTKRLSKPDQQRIQALQKKYNREALLPPNVIPVGKKTYKIEAGEITFGQQAQIDPVAARVVDEIRGAALAPDQSTEPSTIVTSTNVVTDSRNTLRDNNAVR